MAENKDVFFRELARTRKSIRKFKSDPVPRSIIENAIKIAQRAPTSCSGQQYSFIWVTDAKKKEQLASTCSKLINKAPELIVPCVDMRRLSQFVESAGSTLKEGPLTALVIGYTDTVLAATFFMLALESYGLGSCCLGSFQSKAGQVAEILGLPSGVLPTFGIVFGYPAENPPPRPRISPSLILHENAYRDPTDSDLAESIMMMNRLKHERYYVKYAGKDPNYGWNDHLVHKWGGEWLKEVEQELLNSLKKQGFFPSANERGDDDNAR